MAKKKSSRETVGLVCKECKSQNYATTRNKVNIEGKFVTKKYCKTCNKVQEHKETTKLK